MSSCFVRLCVQKGRFVSSGLVDERVRGAEQGADGFGWEIAGKAAAHGSEDARRSRACLLRGGYPPPMITGLPATGRHLMLPCMFTVDDATAEAIRRACAESGELAGVVELRRHFPLLEGAMARDCVRRIVGWRLPLQPVRDRP